MMLNRNLELFIKVAEYGSITKAAKALYITQPAISNALAKLEGELGVKLFFRDKRNGLLLTEVGKQILLLSRQMEGIDNRIYQTAYQEKHLLRGRLRIAVLTSLVSTILSKALKKYRNLYPDIDIELKEGTPNDIFTMVEEHSVDFAVSCSPFGKFDSIALRHDRMMAMFPPEYPAGYDVDLRSPRNILILNQPAYETILDHRKEKEAIKIEKVLLVQNAETAVHMVKEGIGVGILSEYTLDTLAPGWAQYRVLPEIRFDIGLFANDLQDLTPSASAFVKIIQETARL